MNEDVSFFEMVIHIVKALFDFFKDLFNKISSTAENAGSTAEN